MITPLPLEEVELPQPEMAMILYLALSLAPAEVVAVLEQQRPMEITADREAVLAQGKEVLLLLLLEMAIRQPQHHRKAIMAAQQLTTMLRQFGLAEAEVEHRLLAEMDQ